MVENSNFSVHGLNQWPVFGRSFAPPAKFLTLQYEGSFFDPRTRSKIWDDVFKKSNNSVTMNSPLISRAVFRVFCSHINMPRPSSLEKIYDFFVGISQRDMTSRISTSSRASNCGSAFPLEDASRPSQPNVCPRWPIGNAAYSFCDFALPQSLAPARHVEAVILSAFHWVFVWHDAIIAHLREQMKSFLAHIVMPDGQTVGEMTRPRIAEAYQSGEVRPLLEGPRQ